MKCLVLGDLHGDFEALNDLVSKERPDVILQCGDFGYRPRRYPGWPPEDPPLMLGETLLYWCEGNHDDQDMLTKNVTTDQLKVAQNCFYQPRGSIINLPDGQRVYFFGGAAKTDQDFSLDLSLNELPDIDIVITHTAPTSFKLSRKDHPKGYAKGPWLQKFDEQTPLVLDVILTHIKPRKWFFGHYHIYQSGHYGGVDWTALAMPFENGPTWWVEYNLITHSQRGPRGRQPQERSCISPAPEGGERATDLCERTQPHSFS